MDGSNGNRHQRRNRNKIIMATWNVRSMLQPGKMQEIANDDKEERKTQVGMVGRCA
jgi:hypothetical protein